MSIVGRIEYPQDNGSERYDENSRDETSDVNIAAGNHFLTALVQACFCTLFGGPVGPTGPHILEFF